MRVREATTTAMGVAGGGRTEAIMREIARLRAQRDELDSRIRFFESQLRVGAAPATLPPSLSTKLDAMGLHAAARGGSGLSPDAVRRYSRHLLLPDFGVQGWLFTCNLPCLLDQLLCPLLRRDQRVKRHGWMTQGNGGSLGHQFLWSEPEAWARP